MSFWDWFGPKHLPSKPNDTGASLDYIAAKLADISKRQAALMGDTSKLTAAVAANTQAVADVQALVTSLKSGTTSDQAAIDAAASQVEANNAALEALKTTAPSS